MRILKTLLIFFSLMLLQSFAAHQLYADIDGISIPAGTKLTLVTSSDVTTSRISQGDMFQSYLKNDLYVNRKLILPSRTIFRGRVGEVKPSRRLSRPASLYLTLDHLVTKKGTQLPIMAGISTNFNYVLKSNGTLTTNSNYFTAVRDDVKRAGQIVPRTIKWGATSGDNLFTGAKYVFIPVSALGGSIACVGSSAYNTIADLFRRGEEIVIPKGAEFDIILTSPLEIPN